MKLTHASVKAYIYYDVVVNDDDDDDDDDDDIEGLISGIV